MGFHEPVFPRIRTESTILFSCRRIRVSEKPYSCIFYAVLVENLLDFQDGIIDKSIDCVKHVRIWSYPGPYFPAFGLNTDQRNSEYGHFSRSD